MLRKPLPSSEFYLFCSMPSATERRGRPQVDRNFSPFAPFKSVTTIWGAKIYSAFTNIRIKRNQKNTKSYLSFYERQPRAFRKGTLLITPDAETEFS